MNEPITGKVAAIVDDTTLVLSVGSRDGVTEGMVFAIVAEHQDIRDPDTEESLGKWESVKGRVGVTHVQERMATARSPFVEADPGSTATLSAAMVRHSFGLYGDHTHDRERLDVRSGDLSGRPRAQPIAVGDTARSICLEDIVDATSESAPSLAAPDLPSQTYVEVTPPAETDAAETDAAETDADD